MADVELITTQWLDQQLDGVRVCNETPADLEGAVPLVKVTVAGGTDSDDGDTFEFATVVTESFARSRGEAITLGLRVKRSMRRDMPGSLVNSGLTVISKTQTIAFPGVVPYDNTDLRRVLGSYRVFAKSRIAA